MPAPYEVFASGAFDVYLAPALTAEPVIEAAPPVAWIKVGVAGSYDYGEDGIKIKKGTDENEVYGLGLFGVRKVFRTRERLNVMLPLMDATLEALRDAFNQTAVTVIAGPPARKRMPLMENSSTPTTRALLIKGANSPYMDGGVLQWWIPIVYNTGDTEFALKKADPVVIELDFIAVADATNGFGYVQAQTA